MWRNYVNVFCLAFDLIGSYPLNSETGGTTGLLYRVQPAVSGDFFLFSFFFLLPVEEEAMQFTCAAAPLMAAQAGVSFAVSFMKCDICYFHTLSDISDRCRGGLFVWFLYSHTCSEDMNM